MISAQLRKDRAKLIMDAKALINLTGVTDEQLAQADVMLAESDKLMAKIERAEKADQLSASLDERVRVQADVRGVSADQARDENNSEKARESRLLRAYLIGPNHNGSRVLASDDERRIFAQRLAGVQASSTGQVIGTSGLGGYTVAPAWANELLIAMKAFGGMRQVARTISTDTSATLPFVLMDDTAQTGSILAENAQVTADTDLQFTTVNLGAYKYKTGLLTASLELLQDSAFDIDSIIRDAMATRLARIHNTHFTVGTGSGQPQGVVVGAASGTVGTTGQTTTVIFDDLINLEHSIDPAYRSSGNCRWMMHDSSLKVIKKLKDGQNRPLFLPGYTVGAPDTILGYPIAINQDVAVMAANAKSILFGDFNNYLIRDVTGMQMVVLRERFADYLQVGYIGWVRVDGKLISAAQPIKYYANSAT